MTRDRAVSSFERHDEECLRLAERGDIVANLFAELRSIAPGRHQRPLRWTAPSSALRTRAAAAGLLFASRPSGASRRSGPSRPSCLARPSCPCRALRRLRAQIPRDAS